MQPNLYAALCREMCALLQTPSLQQIQPSTSGTKEGSPDHGNMEERNRPSEGML